MPVCEVGEIHTFVSGVLKKLTKQEGGMDHSNHGIPGIADSATLALLWSHGFKGGSPTPNPPL